MSASKNPASVAAFLVGTGPVTSYWHRKYRVLAVFYRFALRRGYVGSSPLPPIMPRRPERPAPHIYTTDE
jgi:integrase/recombinase XerD